MSNWGKIDTTNPYPFKHWMTTLAFGPFLQIIYAILYTPEYKFTNDSFGIYILMFGFGLFFSLPLFVLYLLLFNILIRNRTSVLLMKIILNLATIIGLIITIHFIGGTAMTNTLSLIYAIAIIISSLCYKIKKSTNQPNTQI